MVEIIIAFVAFVVVALLSLTVFICTRESVQAVFTVIASMAHGCLIFIVENVQAVLYVLLIDKNGGNTLLQKECTVKAYLTEVASVPDDYNITTFERCLLKYQPKKTKMMTHAYYLFAKKSN